MDMIIRNSGRKYNANRTTQKDLVSSVPDEDYSANVSCELILIST